MNIHALSESSLSAEQKQLAGHVGGLDGVMAVRLRHQLVESRYTPGNGTIKLAIHAPQAMQGDNEAIRDWAQKLFTYGFRDQSGEIAVDQATTKDGSLIGVELRGKAAEHYHMMMRNLDLAEQSLEKSRGVAR